MDKIVNTALIFYGVCWLVTLGFLIFARREEVENAAFYVLRGLIVIPIIAMIIYGFIGVAEYLQELWS